jgi:hypothetical protein
MPGCIPPDAPCPYGGLSTPGSWKGSEHDVPTARATSEAHKDGSARRRRAGLKGVVAMIGATVAATGMLSLAAAPASARLPLSVLLCVTPQDDGGSPCAPPNTYRGLNQPANIFATAASPPVGAMVSLWDENGTSVAACVNTNSCYASVRSSTPVTHTYVARVTWSGTAVGRDVKPPQRDLAVVARVTPPQVTVASSISTTTTPARPPNR